MTDITFGQKSIEAPLVVFDNSTDFYLSDFVLQRLVIVIINTPRSAPSIQIARFQTPEHSAPADGASAPPSKESCLPVRQILRDKKTPTSPQGVGTVSTPPQAPAKQTKAPPIQRSAPIIEKNATGTPRTSSSLDKAPQPKPDTKPAMKPRPPVKKPKPASNTGTSLNGRSIAKDDILRDFADVCNLRETPIPGEKNKIVMTADATPCNVYQLRPIPYNLREKLR